MLQKLTLRVPPVLRGSWRVYHLAALQVPTAVPDDDAPLAVTVVAPPLAA